MPLYFLKGDLRRTAAQAILLGVNLRGEVEVNPLETDLRDLYPVFFSEYRRHTPYEGGQLWFFREAHPWLIGAAVRDSANGVTRMRYVEQAMLRVRRDWQQERLQSLAIAPLGDELDGSRVRPILEEQLGILPLPILIYETYLPQQPADEPPLV